MYVSSLDASAGKKEEEIKSRVAQGQLRLESRLTRRCHPGGCSFPNGIIHGELSMRAGAFNIQASFYLHRYKVRPPPLLNMYCDYPPRNSFVLSEQFPTRTLPIPAIHLQASRVSFLFVFCYNGIFYLRRFGTE